LFALPKGRWDLDVLGKWIRVERPPRPDDLAIAPITRRGEPWAAIAFVRGRRPFEHTALLSGT
jgi:hypothetical protein